MSGPWTRDEASASGQVFEFRVWAALTEQSRGSLHLFLPLTDRGVDGLVHRLTDGVYIPVLLDGKLNEVAEAVNKNDTDALLANGRFLEDRFGASPLQLPVPGQRASG
ncbi:MAG TPA: hypothetical protein VIO34_00675 [Candidatus Dormibacteraeota bacterium]